VNGGGSSGPISDSAQPQRSHAKQTRCAWPKTGAKVLTAQRQGACTYAVPSGLLDDIKLLELLDVL